MAQCTQFIIFSVELKFVVHVFLIVVHSACGRVFSFTVVKFISCSGQKGTKFTNSNYKQMVLMMSKPQSMVWSFCWGFSKNVCIIQIMKRWNMCAVLCSVPPPLFHNPSLMWSCFLDFWYLIMSVCITLIKFPSFSSHCCQSCKPKISSQLQRVSVSVNP